MGSAQSTGNNFGYRLSNQSGVFVTLSSTRSETIAGNHTTSPRERAPTTSLSSASVSRDNRVSGAFLTDRPGNAQIGTSHHVQTPANGPPGVAGRKNAKKRGTASSSLSPTSNANDTVGRTLRERVSGTADVDGTARQVHSRQAATLVEPSLRHPSRSLV